MMMSTGLTFGLVTAVFGLNNALINQTEYSVITGILVLSAILPTFVAEKYYTPVHSEDLGDWRLNYIQVSYNNFFSLISFWKYKYLESTTLRILAAVFLPIPSTS